MRMNTYSGHEWLAVKTDAPPQAPPTLILSEFKVMSSSLDGDEQSFTITNSKARERRAQVAATGLLPFHSLLCNTFIISDNTNTISL